MVILEVIQTNAEFEKLPKKNTNCDREIRLYKINDIYIYMDLQQNQNRVNDNNNKRSKFITISRRNI